MSDEGHVTCGYKLTAECDFSNMWLCGYKTSKTTKLSWVRRGEGRNKHMAVDFNYGIKGDQASMESPRFEVPSSACLSFKYILDPQTDLRVYVTDIGRKIELTPCGLLYDLDWRQINLPLPNGTFSLSFEATLTGWRHGVVVSVDDIHIEHEKCIDESIYPFTTAPEVTTEVPSTTTSRPQVNWWNITRDLFDTRWPEFNRTNSSLFSTRMTTSPTTVRPEVKIELLRHLNQWFNVSICRNYTEAVEDSLPNPDKEDCATRESTECDFEGECHCGYQMFSSNKFIDWKKETKFGGHASRWYPSASDHFIKTQAIPGQPVRTADWTRLVSPVVTVTKVSCMRFKYTTNQAQLSVLTQNNTDVTLLAEVPGAMTDRAWKHLYLPLHPGTYSVGFEVKIKEPATFSAGIDGIEIVGRRCAELSRSGLQECDFSRGDNCNFIDRSEGFPRWVVNKQIGSEEPGGYFMYAESPSSSKSSSVLLSPEYRLRDPGCLRFFYFMDTDLEGSISTLSVMAQVSQGSQVLLWSVRGLQSSAWMEAVAALPHSYFRFLFEFNGQRSRAGIDKVSVMERHRCPTISCNADQFLCSTSLTCIPNEALCDGIENCQNGDDEQDCTDTDNNRDEREEVSLAMENPSEPEYDLSTVSDERREASLKNIFETSGHQGIDFIYKCKWDGKRCSYENFTQQITDYGLCYTFNGDGQLTTEKTGSRFGLSLTLNIEQYEYMAGPNSDAGVKVYLHEGKEVAQVRDLGFAISPGTHALVAVRINEAENLKEPWGSCGELELEFYDEYFYSRCLRECETQSAVKHCGCRDAYMPGRSLDDPPICNLTKYFGCVIPMTETFTAASPCGCPDPCRHTVYEPVLSYAAISTSNLNFILNENVERLRLRYDKVLESNERVTKDTFASAIKQVKDVSDHYRQLLRFVNLYIGTGKSSVFTELGKTMSTITHLFRQDIDILFEEISDFVESYDSRFFESDRTFVKYLKQLGSTITDLIQILELVSTGAGANKAIELEIDSAIGLAKISRETAASLKRKREEYKREERYKVRGSKFLLYNDENECRNQFNRLDQMLGDVNTAFSSAKRVISFNTDRKASISEMVQLQGLYEQVSGAVVKCLTDYSRLIRNISSWNETVTVDIEQELSKYNDDSEDQYGLASSYNMMDEDLKLVDGLYRKYRLAVLRRHELLGQFTADIGRMARVKNFASILKYKVSDKLNADVTNLQEKLRTHYLMAMKLAGDLEYYRGSGYFYDKGRAMKIWQLPMVNLDDPERYILKGQEVWKIWNRNMPTKEFAQTQGREQIENNLDNYTHTVFKILEGFDEQLLVHETKMIEAIETLNTQQDIETRRRTLNKEFAENNFLKMDVYFAQLKRQTVRQIKAYVNTDFLSDIGGFMGLLLGGSVLTVFELLDLIIYNGMLKLIDRRHGPRRGRTAEKDNNSTPERRKVTMGNEVFTKVNRNDIFNNV